jgi:hypothetical protein
VRTSSTKVSILLISIGVAGSVAQRHRNRTVQVRLVARQEAGAPGCSGVVT